MRRLKPWRVALLRFADTVVLSERIPYEITRAALAPQVASSNRSLNSIIAKAYRPRRAPVNMNSVIDPMHVIPRPNTAMCHGCDRSFRPMSPSRAA